jgi:hypothetical protein
MAVATAAVATASAEAARPAPLVLKASTLRFDNDRIRGSVTIANPVRRRVGATRGSLARQTGSGIAHLKRFRVPALPPRANRRVRLSASVALDPGRHALLVCVDLRGKLARFRAARNCQAAGHLIVPSRQPSPLPDPPFTGDRTPPGTTIVAAPSGRVPTGPASVSFVADEAGSTFACSLDGAAFTPCASPVTTPALGIGRHTFSVRATDTAGNTDVLGAHASWQSAAPRIDLCGPLATSRTLSPDEAFVYVLTCPVTVESGATLTLAAGTVVKAKGAQLRAVGGRVVASGTAASPVVLTSLHDAGPGGETDNSRAAAPGDWDGLLVSSGPAAAGNLDLTHVRLSFADTAIQGTLAVGNSSVALEHVRVERSQRAGFDSASTFARVTIRSSAFADNGRAAGWCGPGCPATGGVHVRGFSVSITDSSFAGTAEAQALRVRSESTPTVRDNLVSGTGAGSGCAEYCQATVRVDSPELDLGRLGGNSGIGNAFPSFALAGTLVGRGSLGTLPGGWAPVLDGRLIVSAGATLTIPAGTVVKSTGSGLEVAGGQLLAHGTATDPIVFTSIHDAGGPTHPAPGAWDGLYVSDEVSGSGAPNVPANLELTHVRIAFARTAVAGSPAAGSSSVVLDHVLVEGAQQAAFDAASAFGSVTIRASTFEDNGQPAGWCGPGCPAGGGVHVRGFSVSITDSTFSRTAGSQALSVRSEFAPTVRDNLVSDNGAGSGCSGWCQATVRVESPQLDLGRLTGNSGLGNAQPSFGFAGILVANGSLATMPMGWTPVLDGGLIVSAGVTLTVPAGTVMKASGLGIHAVGGRLLALGTAADPIVFTSLQDEAPGGVTDTSRPPVKGAWDGLSVSDGRSSTGELISGGRLELSHVRLSFAETAVQSTPLCDSCLPPPPPADASSIVLDHVRVDRTSDAAFDTSSPLGSVTLTDSVFADNGRPAGACGPGCPPSGTVHINARAVSVTDSAFTGTAAGQALRVFGHERPVVRDNVISDSGAGCVIRYCDPTVHVGSDALDLDLVTGNGGTGNLGQSFGLGGTTTGDGTLASLPNGWTPIVPSRLAVGADSTLTIPPGTLLKFGSGARFEVDASSEPEVRPGTLIATGTAQAPIVFTSLHDAIPGGPTDDSVEPVAGVWEGIRFENPRGYDQLASIAVKYADAAIAVGRLVALDVHQSQFTKNERAFTVDRTDVVLPVFGDLPCAPPYTSYVAASNNWFGTTGFPGLEIDPSEFVGLALPPPFSAMWELESEILEAFGTAPEDVTLGKNTIPVALYSCVVEGITIGPVPMFPVNPVMPLSTPPFPDIDG